MADKQVEKGDNSHPPPPSTGQDAPDGGVQQETAYSESDFFFSAEFSKHQSGENGDHLSLLLLNTLRHIKGIIVP